MIPGSTYVWYRDQVVPFSGGLQVEDFAHEFMVKYLYCPTVLVYDGITNCGFFDQTERFDIFFRHQNPKAHPEEFRLSLLIMGVAL